MGEGGERDEGREGRVASLVEVLAELQQRAQHLSAYVLKYLHSDTHAHTREREETDTAREVITLSRRGVGGHGSEEEWVLRFEGEAFQLRVPEEMSLERHT
jgi:hypothetical protein